MSQSVRLGRVYLTGPIVFIVGRAVLGRTLISGEVDNTTSSR
jgi:hypothetical protein